MSTKPNPDQSTRENTGRTQYPPAEAWSSDSEPWFPCLEIRTLRETIVLPWDRFVHAHGNQSRITVVFPTFEIVVEGTQLDSLLADIAMKRVRVIREAHRTEQFYPSERPQITKIEIEYTPLLP